MDEKRTIYQQIFYSTGKYVILKNIFMFISGIIGIFVVRLLGPYEYGRYSLVWQLIGTIGPIVSLGWLTTLAKFIPEKNTISEKSELFSWSIISVTIFTTVAVIGIVVFSYLVPHLIPVEVRQIKFIFGIFIGLVAFFNIFEGMYRGLGKFNEWTIVDGLRSNLASILAIILILVGYRYYQSVIFSNFIFAVLFIICLFYYLRKYLNIRSLNLVIEKPVRNFALTMLFGQIIFLLGISIDSILLRVLLKDPAQVGFYNAGIRIPKMLEAMLIAPLATPFLYYFSHPDMSFGREKILEFGSKILGVFFGIISMFLFSFAREIILILFGHNYAESIMVLRVFSLVLFILGFSILIGTYFTSVNRPEISIFAGALSFILFFIFDILLIPVFKSTGPAISVVIGLIAQALWLNYLLLHLQINCMKNFLLLLSGVVISAVVGFYLRFYLSFGLFVVFIFLSGLLTGKDIKNLKSLILNYRKSKDDYKKTIYSNT